METLSIVAKFYIPGNILSGVFTGRVDGAVDPFDFHGSIEGFGEGVVETHSSGSDRLPDAEEVRRGRERHAGILGVFNRSLQHLDNGGVDGQASWVDEGIDGQVGDEVAGGSVASAGRGAIVLV